MGEGDIVACCSVLNIYFFEFYWKIFTILMLNTVLIEEIQGDLAHRVSSKY